MFKKERRDFVRIEEKNLGQTQLSSLLKNFEEVIIGTAIADDLKRDFIDKVLSVLGNAITPNL